MVTVTFYWPVPVEMVARDSGTIRLMHTPKQSLCTAKRKTVMAQAGVYSVRGCTDLEPVARSCDRAVNEMYSCLI